MVGACIHSASRLVPIQLLYSKPGLVLRWLWQQCWLHWLVAWMVVSFGSNLWNWTKNVGNINYGFWNSKFMFYCLDIERAVMWKLFGIVNEVEAINNFVVDVKKWTLNYIENWTLKVCKLACLRLLCLCLRKIILLLQLEKINKSA